MSCKRWESNPKYIYKGIKKAFLSSAVLFFDSSFKAGAQGVCRTHYVISEDPKANHITVTKSKDLSHCQERIMKDVGLAYTERCHECTEVMNKTGMTWNISSTI